LHDIIQNPVDPIAVAIGGDDRAVIPGTVGISKEVVAGLARTIHAGQIEAPWSIFAGDRGHPSGLLGASDCLRSGDQDHDRCDRALYFTPGFSYHAYLLSYAPARVGARADHAEIVPDERYRFHKAAEDQTFQ